MLLLFRYARSRTVTALWIVVLVSFAYSCYAVRTNAAEAFFSTAGRAWELGLGALLAWGPFPKLQTKKTAGACAAIGALLILACFLAYTDTTRFPGVAALPLCVGAALVIHSGTSSTSAVGALLSSRVMVGLGLISYSVYLWHWPLLVFALYRFPSIFSGEGSLVALWLLGAASVVVGALSWWLVEQPFRRMRKVPQAAVFLSGGLAVATTFAISSVMLKHPRRLQHWPQSIEAMQFKKTIAGSKQGLAHADGWPDRTVVVGLQGSVPDVVVWGDSHGEAMIPGFVQFHSLTGQSAIIAALPGCSPLIGVSFAQRRNGAACQRHNEKVFDAILKNGSKKVVLIAFWSSIEESLVLDPDGSAKFGKHRPDGGRAFEAVLRSMVGKLTRHGKEVVLVGPTPVQKFYVAPAIARHIAWGEPLPDELSRADFLKDKQIVFDVFSRMSAMPHVRVVYPDKNLCDAQSCDYVENGAPFYSDDDHLAPAGVARLNDMFANVFAQTAP